MSGSSGPSLNRALVRYIFYQLENLSHRSSSNGTSKSAISHDDDVSGKKSASEKIFLGRYVYGKIQELLVDGSVDADADGLLMNLQRAVVSVFQVQNKA